MIGIIRTCKARLQNRIGASVLQPYRDLIKLFHKDEIISEDASWIFRFAPYLIFASTLALAAGIPLINGMIVFAPMSDVLVFAYTLALGAFFMALAGMDTGSAFGGFGSSREMLFAALTEGGLVVSLFAVSLIAHTTNLAAMTSVLPTISGIALLALVLAGISFVISLLSENARYPVDNPATHLELTMVHEAMILEYSGKRLALMEWAASNKLLIFTAVLANVFFPWELASDMSLSQNLGAFAIFLVKIFAVSGGIALLESSMAKLRIFRVPDLLFTSLALSVIAILMLVI